MLQSLDILILLALGIGVVRGFMTGAVRQIVSFFGILIAIILAVQLMNPVGRMIGTALGASDALYPAIGLLAVFLLVQIVLFFVVRAVESAVKTFRLSTVNRMLGGAAGLAKAALILSLFFLGLAHFNIPEEDNRQNSVLYDPVASALPATWDYVAEHLPRIKSLSDRLGEKARTTLETP